jgi:hypothetical protein
MRYPPTPQQGGYPSTPQHGGYPPPNPQQGGYQLQGGYPPTSQQGFLPQGGYLPPRYPYSTPPGRAGSYTPNMSQISNGVPQYQQQQQQQQQHGGGVYHHQSQAGANKYPARWEGRERNGIGQALTSIRPGGKGVGEMG